MQYTNYDLQDTIVALATPPGAGAIGVIRLSGKAAINIINQVFPKKDLTQQASHTIHFGTIKTDKGRIIDEVLVSLFVAPKSYTKENVVEVSCHGSNYIIQAIIQLFIKKGARLAQPGEFTLRAFLNGQMDLSQAEAVADLIAANSASAHAIAMQQMRGGFSNEIKNLRQQLLDFASLIELELDFSEEDVEFANRTELKNLVQKIQSLIHSLIQSFQLGNVLKKGINTVIAGRPNAGKSTLLNALLKEERAIVSAIAGTTRDTIEEILNINGIEFRLIDTAGIRDAQDQIEAIGVKKTMEKVQSSAVLLYVFDASQLSPETVHADLKSLKASNQRVLLVPNKMDKTPHLHPEKYVTPTLPLSQIIPVSAINNRNIEHLKNTLYNLVITEKINFDNPIISNTRHLEALQNAHQSLAEVLNNMKTGVTADFVAMDIRQALYYLGEIVGEVSTDDLLGNIFGRFCIGK